MIDKSFYKTRSRVTLKEVAIASKSTLEDVSKERETITDIATMQSAGETELCFFYDRKSKELAAEMKAKACVTSAELRQYVPERVICLISEDPKLSFIKLNEAMYSEYKPKQGIDATAQVAASAQIGIGAMIGAHVIIGENVEIGSNCIIDANTVIGRGCKIGDGCRIGSNVSIMYSLIGNKCRIYSGARIGQDGFGFQLIEGRHHRIPQLGRVIIGNDVEVGANSCIDRGALDDTIIGDGCRIDNLVQIAHNDKIGNGCVVVAQVGIAGSTTLGNYVVLGGQVGIADHLHIGDGVQIAAQSGVMRDVEAGSTVMGSPCVPFKDYMRQVAFLQKNSKK